MTCYVGFGFVFCIGETKHGLMVVIRGNKNEEREKENREIRVERVKYKKEKEPGKLILQKEPKRRRRAASSTIPLNEVRKPLKRRLRRRSVN